MCDADPFAMFDSLLDGAINIVQLVEKASDRLSDDQRYQVVVHSLCYWAWGQPKSQLDDMYYWIAAVDVDRTYQGFLNYMETKYDLRPTGPHTPPIQQFLDDVRELGEQIDEIHKERDKE